MPPMTLQGIDGDLLPREVTDPIFNRATEQSAVMQLARRVPLPLGGHTAVPVSMDVPLADWVAEGARKPVSSSGVEVRLMQPRKVATLVPVSMELARTNPGGLYSQLQSDLSTALARAFDFAVIHGQAIVGGGAGPFTSWLTQTTNTVQLGTATQPEGGVYADIVTGMQELVNDNWVLNGFLADPRLKPRLLLATDLNGRPIFVDTTEPGQGAAGAGTLIGEPLRYSPSVSGRLNRQSTTTDTGLRAIGGDWSQIAYGVGLDITVRISDQATYVDAEGNVVSAFQNNLILLLCEAIFGVVFGDVNAFVTYTDTPGGS